MRAAVSACKPSIGHRPSAIVVGLLAVADISSSMRRRPEGKPSSVLGAASLINALVLCGELWWNPALVCHWNLRRLRYYLVTLPPLRESSRTKGVIYQNMGYLPVATPLKNNTFFLSLREQWELTSPWPIHRMLMGTVVCR